ncbi:MAG: hypothetical protein GF411_19455 [Candidatus Lokiarchaeota archaeon]|nr:hypothetical protein [Candidatus Lokiarchaeota archaeon]
MSGPRVKSRHSKRGISWVSLLILAILKDKPVHGYTILQKLGRRLGETRIKSGTLYPALHRMEEKGLIKGRKVPQEGKPDTTEYELTDKGQEVLNEAIDSFSYRMQHMGKILNLVLESVGQDRSDEFYKTSLHERSPLVFMSIRQCCEDPSCHGSNLVRLRSYKRFLQKELAWVNKQLKELKNSDKAHGGEKTE